MATIIPNIPVWMQHQQQRVSDYLNEGHRGEQAMSLLGEDEKQQEDGQNNVQTVTSTVLRHVRRLPLPALRRSSTQTRKLHVTSYLDGLRGTAAFIVFLHHGTQAFLPSLRPGWASSPDSLNLLALPIIRVIYSGGAMVSIFFVISGYVLSIRPLQLAAKAGREKISQTCGPGQDQGKSELDAAYANIASAAFRRGPRLFIPCLVSTLLTAIIGQLGFFVQGANIGLQRSYPRAESWIAQLGNWWSQNLYFINPFAGKHDFEENTWTIPAEFKGSLLVFLTVMAVAGRSSRMRRACIWLGMAYWTWLGTWDLMQFLAGISIAEWSSSRRTNHTEDTEEGLEGKSTRTSILHWLLALVALYLLSMPEGDENVANSPGYITLATTLTPEGWHSQWGPGRWWPTWGAILFVATLDHAGEKSIFQRIFTSRFAQFLGDISFSLYLLHGITIYTVGVRVVKFFTEIFGDQTREGYVLSLILGAAITLPFLFWISLLFTDVVDKGAVDLARRMAKW